MKERKLYCVMAEHDGMEPVKFLSADAVTYQYAKGFIAGIRQYNPCPALKLMLYFGGLGWMEEVEAFEAKGEVKPT